VSVPKDLVYTVNPASPDSFFHFPRSLEETDSSAWFIRTLLHRSFFTQKSSPRRSAETCWNPRHECPHCFVQMRGNTGWDLILLLPPPVKSSIPTVFSWIWSGSSGPLVSPSRKEATSSSAFLMSKDSANPATCLFFNRAFLPAQYARQGLLPPILLFPGRFQERGTLRKARGPPLWRVFFPFDLSFEYPVKTVQLFTLSPTLSLPWKVDLNEQVPGLARPPDYAQHTMNLLKNSAPLA